MAGEEPWYRDGLEFSCTRCGHCCTGKPGYVWVGEVEIARLCEALSLSTNDFGAKYLRQVGNDLSLIEKPNNDCIFWDSQGGCTVYASRPNQCRTWPFWEENLETPEDWAETQRSCPGSGQGRLYALTEIQNRVKSGPE